jgi:hypothetical protein
MTMAISLRSSLIAGTAAVVGISAMATAPATSRPVALELPLPAVSVPFTLSALDVSYLSDPEVYAVGSPIEVAIKDTYLALEPWAAYAAELTQYVLGFIPGVWWLAPAIDLAYFTIEPLVQAGVFVVADVLGGNFAQIPIDINTGIQDSINNAFYFGLAWLESLVPLPPLPPFPPLPGAAVDRAELVRAGASRGTAVTPVVDAPVVEAVTDPAVDAPVVEAVTDPVVDAPVVETVTDPVVDAPVVETVTDPVADNKDVSAESVTVPKESPTSADGLGETTAVSDTDTAEVAPAVAIEDALPSEDLPAVDDIVADTAVSDPPPDADVSATDTPAQDTTSENTRSRTSSRTGR